MFAIAAVTVDKPCRVRLYESFAAAEKDRNRPATQPPAKGEAHGVVMDIVITEKMEKTFRLSPMALTPIELEKLVIVIEPKAEVKLAAHVV